MERDPVLRALDDLERALTDNARRSEQMLERIAEIRRQRAAGRTYREVVPSERNPLIVSLLTESALALDSAGSRLRRSEAQALHDEGLTMEQIADLFGVTRQRVSALLRDGRRPAN